MPLTNPPNAANQGYTPGGTIASSTVQSAIAEAAAEALQKANNLSDLANKLSAWGNLGGSQNLSTSGYIKLPNGFIFQWTRVIGVTQNIVANNYYYYSAVYPIAFNTLFRGFGCLSGGLSSGVAVSFENQTNTGLTPIIVSTQSYNSYTPVFDIFAVGI